MFIFFRAIILIILTTLIQGCYKEAKKPIVRSEVVKIIDQINKKNEKIINIWYKEVKFGFVKSMLYCDKEGATIERSEIRGRVVSEVVSKKNLFWFWIRDYKPDQVFYCNMSDISQTRVKDILRPEVTRLIIGIDKIPNYSIKGNQIEFDLKEFHVVSTLDGKNIVRHEVFKNETKVMTAQILDFEDVPKRIYIIWHEENIKLIFQAEKIEINTKTPPNIEFPEGMKKVNLLNY